MEFSLGLVEVSALGNAIMMLDEMLKVADVEFIGVERKLGGALVTVVVRGSVSSVTASVEAGRQFAEKAGVLKAAEVIARPHPEILKFINIPQDDKKETPKQEAKPEKTVAEKKPVAKQAAVSAKVDDAKPKAAKKPVTKTAEKPKTVKKATPKTTKTATKTATKTTKSKAKKA